MNKDLAKQLSAIHRADLVRRARIGADNLCENGGSLTCALLLRDLADALATPPPRKETSGEC